MLTLKTVIGYSIFIHLLSHIFSTVYDEFIMFFWQLLIYSTAIKLINVLMRFLM